MLMYIVDIYQGDMVTQFLKFIWLQNFNFSEHTWYQDPNDTIHECCSSEPLCIFTPSFVTLWELRFEDLVQMLMLWLLLVL